MNEKIILFKLLVHWILCQMLSDFAVCSSTDGNSNDFFKTGKKNKKKYNKKINKIIKSELNFP